jgi:hypothetical protein
VIPAFKSVDTVVAILYDLKGVFPRYHVLADTRTLSFVTNQATLKSFPFYKQLDSMDCGPTCLRMVAKSYGKS